MRQRCQIAGRTQATDSRYGRVHVVVEVDHQLTNAVGMKSRVTFAQRVESNQHHGSNGFEGHVFTNSGRM